MKQGALIKAHEWNIHERVIVFDGVCNLCNSFVNFVMDRDPHDLFKFGTLQSNPAQIILKEEIYSQLNHRTSVGKMIFSILKGEKKEYNQLKSIKESIAANPEKSAS